MIYCERCKRLEICERVEKGIAHSCVGFTPKKTRGDKIRQMSDEELAQVAYFDFCAGVCNDPVRCGQNCYEKILEWLRQEVTEDA